MDESHLQFIAAKRFIIGVVPKVHFVCSFRKNFEIRTRNSCSPQLNLWHLNVRQNISCRCFTQSPATDPLKGQCHEIFDTFICLTDSTLDPRFSNTVSSRNEQILETVEAFSNGMQAEFFDTKESKILWHCPPFKMYFAEPPQGATSSS